MLTYLHTSKRVLIVSNVNFPIPERKKTLLCVHWLHKAIPSHAYLFSINYPNGRMLFQHSVLNIPSF